MRLVKHKNEAIFQGFCIDLQRICCSGGHVTDLAQLTHLLFYSICQLNQCFVQIIFLVKTLNFMFFLDFFQKVLHLRCLKMDIFPQSI